MRIRLNEIIRREQTKSYQGYFKYLYIGNARRHNPRRCLIADCLCAVISLIFGAHTGIILPSMQTNFPDKTRSIGSSPCPRFGFHLIAPAPSTIMTLLVADAGTKSWSTATSRQKSWEWNFPTFFLRLSDCIPKLYPEMFSCIKLIHSVYHSIQTNQSRQKQCFLNMLQRVTFCGDLLRPFCDVDDWSPRSLIVHIPFH